MSDNTQRLVNLGLMGLDAKRTSAWASYGYKDLLTYDDYAKAYERNGAAFGAVHRVVDKCWQTNPTIKIGEQEAPKVAAEFKRLAAWAKIYDMDRRNAIGRYAGMVAQIKDGRQWNEPADKGQIANLIPVSENQLEVTAWDTDLTSDRYGQPVMYQFKEASYFTPDSEPARIIQIHWSRVFIFAEGSQSGCMNDGIPMLRAGYNYLVNLEKVDGGSAEGYLKNASRQIAFNYDKDVDVAQSIKGAAGGTVTVAEALNDKVANLNKSIDGAIVMQGGQADILSVSVPDPEPTWRINANEFACSVQLPFTILFGQQTGRLASDQDKIDYANRCASRRVRVLTPMLEQLLAWLATFGAIDQAAYVIEWDDLLSQSDAEKVANAKGLAEVNKAMLGTGTEAFTIDEIRAAAGYEATNGNG